MSILPYIYSVYKDFSEPLRDSDQFSSEPDLRYSKFHLKSFPHHGNVGENFDFEASFNQTQLPLGQRISVPSEKDPTRFLIDNLIEVHFPSSSHINDATNYWTSKRKVAVITTIVASLLAGTALLGGKLAIGAFVAPYGAILTIAAAVLVSAATVLSFVTTLFYFHMYKECETEIAQWQQIASSQLPGPPLPERIAQIRSEIFAQYRQGREIVGNAQGEIFHRCMTGDEILPLIQKGIQTAFPNLPQEQIRIRVMHKYHEYWRRIDEYVDANPDGFTWNYPFPKAYEVRAFHEPA